MQIVDSARLKNAKRANSTRRIDLNKARVLLTNGAKPRAGDLVLARVDKPGHHDGVEEVSGRRASLYAGDEILVCYGNRYAPDQFEAIVPDDIGPCQLVAAGGLAAKALSWHAAMRAPTEITPIGLVARDDSRPLNIRQFRLPSISARLTIPVILSVGTSMNSGKPTTAVKLIHALDRAGLRVGAAKVTGTSAGKDTWLMVDSGACMVLDFNDAGFATTYLEPPREVEEGAHNVMKTLQAAGCDIAVVEIADGLLQQETRLLLERASFKRGVGAVFFSSIDSMGAVAGAQWLRERGYHVAALTGVLTNSPLATREAARASELPVLTLKALHDPAEVPPLLPFEAAIRRNQQSGALLDAAVSA